MNRLNGEQQESLLGVIEELQALKDNEKALKVSIKEKTDDIKLVLREAGIVPAGTKKEDKEVEVVGDWDLILSLNGGGEKVVSKKVTPALVRTYFPKGMSAEAIEMTDPILRLNIKEHKD